MAQAFGMLQLFQSTACRLEHSRAAPKGGALHVLQPEQKLLLNDASWEWASAAGLGSISQV